MKQVEPQLTPLLVNAKSAAHLCGCGLSLWYELAAAGQTPQAVKLHSKKLYSYNLLKLWTDNGCPARDSVAWAELLKAKNNDR